MITNSRSITSSSFEEHISKLATLEIADTNKLQKKKHKNYKSCMLSRTTKVFFFLRKSFFSSLVYLFNKVP